MALRVVRSGEAFVFSGPNGAVVMGQPALSLASGVRRISEWRLADADGGSLASVEHCVSSADETATTVLHGPAGEELGEVRLSSDGTAALIESSGVARLVVRNDGPRAAHVVDCFGDVVAVRSLESPGLWDLLVFTSGEREPLARLLGFMLAVEVAGGRLTPDTTGT